MTELFLKLLNMSISASWLVLAVVALRFLLRKAPKWMVCSLWAMVAIRLVLPFSIESMFSMIPSTQTLPPEILTENRFEISSGIPALDQQINHEVLGSYFEGVTVPVDNGVHVMSVLTVVWLLGMAALAVYATVSYLLLRRRTCASVCLRENIFLCDYIESPFILGILRPRIYLPSALDRAQWPHVIAHEQAHLSRRDHWWKPLGFALLCLHWFNPVLWVAYILLCRDIELACDERVIRDMDTGEKQAYSNALLDCSMPRYWVAACPLAFGEVGVKERVKTVLNYKKPAFWAILLSVVLCMVIAVCFLTDPVSLEQLPEQYSLTEAILDGCVVMIDGDVAANQQVWQDFVDKVNSGQSASVRYVTYYTIGNPDRMSSELFEESRSRYPVLYVHDLSFDGRTFTLRWFEEEKEYVQNWKYLMHYTGTPESPYATYELHDCYMLTDRNDVTYEQLWNGMYSADFRDQIPFKQVYMDRTYHNEPTLQDLEAAKDALEPYMREYSIATLDANELTGRLDIQVREWKDGLFDLIERFIDTDFVTVTELRGELAFTGTLEEKYPMYFNLSDFKGLELYVMPDGSCVLTEGTNRLKTEEEIAAMVPATLVEMKEILASYDIEPKNIFIDNRTDMSESQIRRELDIHPETRIWLELDACSATGAWVSCHIDNLGDGAVWTGYDYYLEAKTDSGWVYYGYPSEELAWEDALQFHSSNHEPVFSQNASVWEEHWSRVADAPLPPGIYRYCHSITLEQDGRTHSQVYYAEFTIP